MIGKTFLYMGTEYVVKEIAKVETDLYRLVTDKRIIRLTWAELQKDFLPVMTAKEKSTGVVLYRGLQLETAQLKDLGNILMDNIRKVQENAAYINQAKSVNESARTLIDLKRTQIEMVKLVKDK
jgi:prophage DNA circulation protein